MKRFHAGCGWLLAGLLAGCNTIAGAGKDIERGGQVIRDTAKDVQKKL